MDSRPLQYVTPLQTPPNVAPARPADATGDFASTLRDALRSGADAAVGQDGAVAGHEAGATALADLASFDPFGFGSEGVISTVSIAERSERLAAELTSRLDRLFADNGIDIAGPVALRSDSHGCVRVVGEHADAARIESFFAESFELQQAFVRVSSSQSLLRAAAEHEAFTAAYAEDPRGAVTRFAHLFSATAPQPDFRLTLSAGEWSWGFE
ncbi:MAG: hypothetical protein R3C10_01825 [Pirellulales bacterium]